MSPHYFPSENSGTFLLQALEARLIGLYHDVGRYQEALADGARLLKELKKLDDKNLLVEVQLLESKTYHALSNLPKARAALTSARTTANSIYVPPKVQAQLDLQSGILHASEEKDFKTAFSYFFEAFEGFDSVDDPMAIMALKYMLMSKVMLNLPDEVTNLVSGKLALKYVLTIIFNFQIDYCCFSLQTRGARAGGHEGGGSLRQEQKPLRLPGGGEDLQGPAGGGPHCQQTPGQPLQQHARAESLQVKTLQIHILKNENITTFIITESSSPTARFRSITWPARSVCPGPRSRRNCPR